MTQQAEIQGRVVWVPNSFNTGGRQLMYHLREDCSEAEVRKVGLEQLNGMHRLCQRCKDWSDEFDYTLREPGSRSVSECPICGEEVTERPRHIRACHGGAGDE